MGLRLFSCWDSSFESHSGHERLYLFSVMFRQEKAPDLGLSPVQVCANECGVFERDREASIMRIP